MELRHHSSIILEGLSQSLYVDLTCSRIALRMRRRSCFFLDKSRKEAAPGERSAFGWLMFRPIPRIAKETRSPRVLDSMRIPPSFSWPRTRSLGHFNLTLTPVSFSRACLVATAARNCNNGSFGLGTVG